MIKENIGSIDRAIRIVTGIVLIGVGAWYLSWWAMIVGMVMILTGIMSSCPLYSLLRISTTPKEPTTTHHQEHTTT